MRFLNEHLAAPGGHPECRASRFSSLLFMLMLIALFASACGRPTATPAALRPPPPTRYQLQLGKSVFQSYCSACHGETGAGDGPNSFNLDPHPRDLGDPAFQKTKADADLADTIRRGGAGVGLSSLMPPWGHTLDPRQIDAVVVYVRSLKR
jgi:mono/diheme cytochrome c family protein